MSFGQSRAPGQRPETLNISAAGASPRNGTNGSPRVFSPTGRSTPSPKLCAISGCPNKRFARGYCPDHTEERDRGKVETPTWRKNGQENAIKGFKDREYPVNRSNEVFRNVHTAWLDGWTSFVSRLKNPRAIPSGQSHSYSRQVLEIIMRLCEFVPAITCSAEWLSREQSMAGKPAQDVIAHWGSVLNAKIDEETVVCDDSAFKLLVMCMMNYQSPRIEEKKETPLNKSIRVNRNMCAQILSSLSMNITNVSQLINLGIIDACQEQFKGHINLESEDMTLQSLLHFLIQGSYIWKTMRPEEYKAREIARSVYQCVSSVLDTSSDGRDTRGTATINARGRALMAVLVRINPNRCQPHCIEHTRALYEVPKLLGYVTHWFYERHMMSESFDDVVTEVIRDIIQNTQSLPAFLQNTMKKALSFGKECAMCTRVAPNLPMVARCSCKQFFYCSRSCQTEHWPAHKTSCKASWQDEILAPKAIS